jgi:minor extracellular protease Epr
MKISLLILLISSIVNAKDIVVMSVDTGVDFSHENLADHHLPSNYLFDGIDNNGHGTHIAGIILKDTCTQVKFISCNYMSDHSPNACFRRALIEKPDYINFSSGGMTFDQEEKDLFTAMIKAGIKIVVAAGNNGKKRPDYYPARYEMKGMTIVGNLDSNGKRHFLSNYGFKRMKWEIGTDVFSTLPHGFGYMTGTSQAAAIYTNKLLRAQCSKLD